MMDHACEMGLVPCPACRSAMGWLVGDPPPTPEEICNECARLVRVTRAEWNSLVAERDKYHRQAQDLEKELAILRARETAPPIPTCARCRHKATMHVVDDEERRECMEWRCACEQFESEDT
jgi:hypothetical protein